MFESQTYENIKKRMLDRVPKIIDTQELSVVFNGIAPSAVELAQVYIELDNLINQTFANTANRTYLIKRATERGKIPKEASKAIVKALFNCSVLSGTRFTCEANKLVYKVTENISGFYYKLECETAGTAGNNVGGLIPVDYVEGLSSATITEILIPAEDDEDTEVFRNRYFESFDAQAYGGNRADYINKVTSISGVGSCKAERIVSETGNIVITILDSTYSKASVALVELVQDTIDPQQDGKGDGLAPFDHVVTIQTVDNVTINITLTAEYDTGYTFDNLKISIEEKIKNYLKTLRQSWANENTLVVRVANIKAELLKINGILDIEDGNLLINGTASNLTLTKYQIPVFGEVSDE